MQAEKQQHIDNVSVLPINTKNTKSKLDLIVFKSSEIAGIWILVEDLIQKACDRAGAFADAKDVKAWLEKGTMQLWVAFDGSNIVGAVVTDIVTYPRMKALCMQFCGGTELKDWKDSMLALLRRYAKDMGCEVIESSRPKAIK